MRKGTRQGCERSSSSSCQPPRIPATCLFSSRRPLTLTHQPLPSHPEPRPSPRLLSDLSHGRHQSSATDQGSRNRAAPSWHEGATAGARIQQNISVTPGCPWCGLQGAQFPARIKDGSGCRNHSPRATDNLLCAPCRAPHLPSAHTQLTQESYSCPVTCHISDSASEKSAEDRASWLRADHQGRFRAQLCTHTDQGQGQALAGQGWVTLGRWLCLADPWVPSH